jgi:hypothetical protein
MQWRAEKRSESECPQDNEGQPAKSGLVTAYRPEARVNYGWPGRSQQECWWRPATSGGISP